jgi:hypothetical protein
MLNLCITLFLNIFYNPGSSLNILLFGGFDFV